MGGAAVVTALYRYPVKGLSPEAMSEAALAPGETVAWDRAFAIENGTADFDPENPRHFPKIKFLMLMRDERLATLTTRFDEPTTTLIISRNGRELARGNLSDAQGRAAIESFVSSYMKDELRGRPRIVHAPGFSISDIAARVVSIINLASVRELAKTIGRPVDPLRFRANIYVDGLDPWEDHGWVGKPLRIGSVEARGFKEIQRCAATNVDPATAARDMEIPTTLLRTYGHANLGLYAAVSKGGTVKPGDTLALA